MRAELDAELGVHSWSIASGEHAQPAREPVDPDAPSWWYGDEDASQSFMAAMGVQ
jgi:hypothetical protein